MTLREKILAAVKQGAQARLVKLPVPEWGIDVYIKRLTLAEKMSLNDHIGELDGIPKADTEGRNRWAVRYMMSVALDEQGVRIFSPEDEQTLYQDAVGTAIESVALTALRINSPRREEIIDLGKDSGAIPNGGSPSVSPATSG